MKYNNVMYCNRNYNLFYCGPVLFINISHYGLYTNIYNQADGYITNEYNTNSVKRSDFFEGIDGHFWIEKLESCC